MASYKHLTIGQRERLYLARNKGESMAMIAAGLGVSKSTVSRELKRNGGLKDYSPSSAQKSYRTRRSGCHPRRILDDVAMHGYVSEKFLCEQWSPEEIAGRIKHEGNIGGISTSTIYRAIYRGDFDRDAGRLCGVRAAVRKLRHRGKKRHKKGTDELRGKIKISHDISERGDGAKDRSEAGHWEADTVLGKSGGACLVTLVDRRSRYAMLSKAGSKTADAVNRILKARLSATILKSVTPDRGKEFAFHAKVTEELGVQFYFPPPHHPWERGTNENTNGLIREYLPKGKSMDDVTDAYIESIEKKINLRPRKCLGYKTPYELFYGKELHLA